MAEAEIGNYVIQAQAQYVSGEGKWQSILCMTRLFGVPALRVSQTFNYFPSLFETESDAIEYGFTKGRALVQGKIMGLTI